MSKIQMSFEEARDKNNIGLILPEFLSSIFYVVGIGDEKLFDFAMTKSPDKKEMCVTVSEDPELVSFDQWSMKSIGGCELLKAAPKNSGILLTYHAGGDYISRKQIDWFLELID